MACKICIITSLHLSSNPRVWKEANSLAEAGYEVVILTNWVSQVSKNKDSSFIQHANISYKASVSLLPGEIGSLQRFYNRARVKISRGLKKYIGFESVWLLGHAPGLMFSNALAEQADLYIAHTEFGIAVGKKLLAQGRKVAFDLEDWYSRDYLVPERPVALLVSLEKFAIENGAYCSCPSQAMATGLQEAYPGAKTIHVIYNGFSINENAVITNEKYTGFSLIWFSQTIGPGRGLETAIEALQNIDKSVELHLVGNCLPGYDEALKNLFPYTKGHTLFIHTSVRHDELIYVLSKHTVGLAIENDFPDNKDKTISNKILQYIQAGIKVLATNTAGQKEVAAYFKDSIVLVSVNDPNQWARSIEILMQSSEIDLQLQFRKFNDFFSWEAQEKKLLELVEKALHD